MKHDKGVAEKTPVDMGVDLSRHYRLMTKHFLNRSQVGSCFDQMSRKRMTESVGTYLSHNTRPACQIAGNIEYHCSGKLPSAAVEKHNILIMYHRKPVPVDSV